MKDMAKIWQISTNTQHTVMSDLSGVVTSLGVKGEGRREKEEVLRY